LSRRLSINWKAFVKQLAGVCQAAGQAVLQKGSSFFSCISLNRTVSA
jgi:hypothetical protein